MITANPSSLNPLARSCYTRNFQDFPIPEKGDSLEESSRKFEEGRIKLLNLFKKNLPKESRDYVNGLFQENSSMSFYTNLLLYAKRLPPLDANDTKLKVIHFALEFFKFSKLFGYMESKRPFEPNSLEQDLADFYLSISPEIPSPSYVKWEISINQLLKLAKISLTKKSTQSESTHYATGLRSLLNIYLKKGPLHHLPRMLFSEKEVKTLDGKQVGNFPVNVAIKTTNNGILLLSDPKRHVETATYDYGTAYKAFEMFIPFESNSSQEFPIRQVRLLIRNGRNNAHFLQEIANCEKLERLPSNSKSSNSISTIYAKNAPFFTKNEGIDSLFCEMNNKFSCLSTLDLLEICDNIADQLQTLTDSDLVHLSIHPNSIFFNKKENKRAKGFLHNMNSLIISKINLPPFTATPWLNALAQKGHLSAETNCFSLVYLIASLFLTDSLDILQKDIPPSLYKKVLALKNQYSHSPDTFAKSLLIYAANMSPTIEDKQFVALRQFAFKTALFPLIKPLVDETLQANNEHKLELEKCPTPLSNEEFLRILALEPKIPSLEKIQETLRNSISKIQEIENGALARYSPYPHSPIDPVQIQEMLSHVLLPNTPTSEQALYADLWLKSLHTCLASLEWIEHNQIRLHKKEEGLPFSYLVQKTTNGIWIKVFSRRFQPNNSGSYKKIKFVLKFFLPKVKNLEVPLIPLSTVIYRVDEHLIDDVLSSYNTHQKLMQLENSEAYLAPKSIDCRQYLGTRSWKWEWESPWYNGTLENVINSGSVQESMMNSSKANYIHPLELIESLISTTLGIELLHSHGIFHKDLKDQNILIKINQQDPQKDEKLLLISITFIQKIAFLKKELENLQAKKLQHIMTNIGSKVKKRQLDSVISRLNFCETQLKEENSRQHCKKVETHISDFDLTSSTSKHNIQNNYFCWDYLCTQGFASKYTDYYSLTILIAEALLPGFFELGNGDNEERKLFYSSLLQDSEQKKHKLYEKKIQKLSPFLDKKGQDLLKPFLHFNQDLSQARTDLLVYAKQLQIQGSASRPVHLQKFAMGTIFFDNVFKLIIKTFRADHRAKTYMAAHHERARSSFETTAKEALEQAGFPTIHEFKDLLNYCTSIAESIESQYKDL